MNCPKPRFVERSCDWIANHLDATTHDLPDNLLREWLLDADAADSLAAGSYLTIFCFGSLLHDLKARDWIPNERLPMSVAGVFRMFAVWQLKLRMTQLHRTTNLHVDPTPIFPCGQNEWLRVSHKSATDVCSGGPNAVGSPAAEPKAG